MISLDTNLLVRLLTNDNKAQARYAAKLIEDHSVVNLMDFLKICYAMG